MAQANDSVLVTPGSGTTIATQLAGGKEHQVVVLADQNGNLDPTQTQKPYTPAAADVLAGSATVLNAVTETTVITIPAGRTWVGTVNVDTAWTGTASTALKFAHIRTLGTNVTPAAGTVLLRVNTTTAGNNQSGQLTVVAPVGNAVTVTVTAGAAVTQNTTGSAAGVLL